MGLVQTLDPYKMQLEVTGFLNKHASTFMSELWSLLLSAQKNPRGYPPELLAAAREKIIKEREAKAGADAAVQARLQEHASKLQAVRAQSGGTQSVFWPRPHANPVASAP